MLRFPFVLITSLAACALAATSALATEPYSTTSRFAGAAAGNWAQPGNLVGPPDDNCANMGAQQKVNTAFNFGFDIPLPATIVEIRAVTKTGEQGDQNIEIQLASDASGEAAATIGSPIAHLVPGVGNGACSSTTEVGNSVGGLLSSWGTNGTEVTPAIVNSPSFGLVYTTIENSSIKVDAICLEIIYDHVELGGDFACFQEPPPEGNSITVVKDVSGQPPLSNWEFDGFTNDRGVIGGFTLPAVGGFMTFEDIPGDIYVFTETPKPGYAVTSECFRDGVLVQSGSEAISIAVGDPVGPSATCIFTNTRFAQFAVFKDFTDEDGRLVSVSLACTNGTVTNSPQLITDGGGPAVFEVEGYFDGVTCSASESVPAGYEWTNPEECTDVDILQEESCVIINEPVPNTVFTVLKNFNDDNTAGVNIYIECTTGLPITSDAVLYEFHPIFDQIDFIVQDFDPGQLDCHIFEDVPDGYTPSYSASIDPEDNDGVAGLIRSDNAPPDGDNGCYFEEVEGGHFICRITNYLQEVEVVVDKLWIDDQAVENGAFLFAGAKWHCNPVADRNDVPWYLEKSWGHLTFHGARSGYRTAGDSPEWWDWDSFSFYPHFEGSECSVTELELDSDVFSDDSDCDDLEIFPGYDLGLEDDDSTPVESCVIINTRIYAGIPTLSEYGLALLALLMLGIGFVGYRRFA